MHELRLPSHVPLLSQVFGISADSSSASYVNRGGLDERFAAALRSDRHIAVHGGSKQGKSWLRSRGLPADRTNLVQCTPASTVETILADALGSIGAREESTTTHTQSISAQLLSEVSVSNPQVADARTQSTLGASSQRATSTRPVGQSSSSLQWVAAKLAESNRKLVLEDFHYLSEVVQKQLAFLIKALGEYKVFVVVVGVWPQDHMLTYFNGDLEGRIEDFRLHWQDSELRDVLANGARALRLRFDHEIELAMIRESYGGVGLLQRLADELCKAEGIERRRWWNRERSLNDSAQWAAALAAVAAQMHGRYQNFADNFVRGMRRLPEGLEVYRYLLQSVTAASDEELLRGLDSAELLRRITSLSGGDGIRQSDLIQALERIDRLQVKIGINPLVLTYSRSGRTISVADRSFCFYRKHGTPQWPWSDEDLTISNDLSGNEPLNLD